MNTNMNTNGSNNFDNDQNNLPGGALGRDNPAHSHNFSLKRYVAESERNAYMHRPIVNIPNEQIRSQPQMSDALSSANDQVVPPEIRRVVDDVSAANTEKEKKTPPNPNSEHSRQMRRDDYVLEPFLGYYPLAGRNTYIGSHKKRINRKLRLAFFSALAIIIVLIFIFFGDRIFSLFKNSDDASNSDTACAYSSLNIDDTI